MRNVAILGGSFDPIHEGHLQIAKEALRQLRVDEVWFLPTFDTPLKGALVASVDNRLQMIRLAIQPFKKMKLNTYEAMLKHKSYTVDTLRHFHKIYKDTNFYFCVGSDQAKQFSKWKDHEELLKLATFCVFSRDLDEKKLPHFTYVTMKLKDVSSTEIRRGEKWFEVPRSVRRYMSIHKLYLTQIVESKMHEKRYEHTKRVAEVCVMIAKHHGLHEEDAYVAGMLHDYCKEMRHEDMGYYMRLLKDDKTEDPIPIWHGYIGAVVYQKKYGYLKKNIQHAIYHHVTGSGISKLSKALYVADKIEWGRNYDTSKLLEEVTYDLEGVYKKVLESSKEYIRKEQNI